MGIDYGKKRIGIALSNEEGTFAFPKAVIKNGRGTTRAIKKIAAEEKVRRVVIGESKDYGGRENPLMKDIRIFKDALEKEKLTIFLEPEYGSSIEASRFQGVGEMHDASAAAIILQRYLDKQPKQ